MDALQASAQLRTTPGIGLESLEQGQFVRFPELLGDGLSRTQVAKLACACALGILAAQAQLAGVIELLILAVQNSMVVGAAQHALAA